MKEQLREILGAVSRGEIGVDAALERLRVLPFEDLGFAAVDHHRAIRQGFPEVIFGQGKTPEQVVAIAERILAFGEVVLCTRVTDEAARALIARFPDARYEECARAAVIGEEKKEPIPGLILVVSAGTSDMPVAEEAAVTAEVMGNRVERLYDVGVAGIHRLVSRRALLDEATVVVVVAGMEGALASVVGGMVAVPVVAVPTSVGYGASFSGLAALLAMLNSCASGVTVVNIDNGFGAGYAAGLMNRLAHSQVRPGDTA